MSDGPPCVSSSLSAAAAAALTGRAAAAPPAPSWTVSRVMAVASEEAGCAFFPRLAPLQGEVRQGKASVVHSAHRQTGAAVRSPLRACLVGEVLGPKSYSH